MIKFLKLTNGEMILSEIISEDQYMVVAMNPIEVSMSKTTNMETARMIGHQWLPLLEDENIIEIQTNHVIAMQEASISIKEFYVDVIDQYIHPEKYEKESIPNSLSEILQNIDSDSANTETTSYH